MYMYLMICIALGGITTNLLRGDSDEENCFSFDGCHDGVRGLFS